CLLNDLPGRSHSLPMSGHSKRRIMHHKIGGEIGADGSEITFGERSVDEGANDCLVVLRVHVAHRQPYRAPRPPLPVRDFSGRNPSGALVLSRDLGLVLAPEPQAKRSSRDGRMEAPVATGR